MRSPRGRGAPALYARIAQERGCECSCSSEQCPCRENSRLSSGCGGGDCEVRGNVRRLDRGSAGLTRPDASARGGGTEGAEQNRKEDGRGGSGAPHCTELTNAIAGSFVSLTIFDHARSNA